MKNEEKHCKWYNDEFCTNADSPCVADYCPVVEYPELCKCREVDNEKELTDEDIANAFECCNTIGMSCNDCPFEKNCDECEGVEQLTIDLIHRLQSRNELLESDHSSLLREADGYIQTIADQKAEIERLTEEHERIAWSKQQYLDWVHGFLTTHTDMKNRGEDYKMFDRDWMCGVFWAKIEGSIEYIIDLENQRNELQKQVDELKLFEEKYNDLAKKYMNDTKTADYIRHRAVKDTAKEIFAELFYIASIHHSDVANILAWAKEKAKSVGVEVE